MQSVPVNHIDITFPSSLSVDDLHPHFHNLIAQIRPEWASNQITVKVFIIYASILQLRLLSP